MWFPNESSRENIPGAFSSHRAEKEQEKGLEQAHPGMAGTGI
jgi:hypothetical protein